MDFLGDPGSIERVASELTTAHSTLTRTHGDLTSGVSRLVPGSWHGGAANAFEAHWATEGASIDALAGAAARMASILDHLASRLRHAKTIAQRAEGIARSHGLAVGSDGRVTSPVAGRMGLPPDPAREQARIQAQDAMSSARSIADEVRSQASAALAGLTVPQVEPGVSPQAAELWAQDAAPGRPGSPPALGRDLWRALRGNVLPPSDVGGLGLGLWGLGRGLTAFGKTSSWMTTVRLGRFAPRDALGRFTSLDAPWWRTGLRSTQGRNWVANPYLSDSRGVWSTAGRWGGRTGGALAIGTSGLSQWMQDSGRSDLSTSQRVGRTAYRGAVAGGAAWAGAVGGAELGGAVGTAIAPGVGTVVGGAIGGVAGGVAGSGAGNWVVDRTVDAAGEGAEAVTDAAGDAAGDVSHAAGDVIDDLSPF